MHKTKLYCQAITEPETKYMTAEEILPMHKELVEKYRKAIEGIAELYEAEPYYLKWEMPELSEVDRGRNQVRSNLYITPTTGTHNQIMGALNTVHAMYYQWK